MSNKEQTINQQRPGSPTETPAISDGASLSREDEKPNTGSRKMEANRSNALKSTLGWLEELWVEKIAVWSWRLRRLIRCESGQIDRALATHSQELQLSKAEDLTEPDSAPSCNPEMDAMTDHLFLPEKEELDKLLRYEAMISRQLNHAIAELERIQARRKGEGTTSSNTRNTKQSQEVL